MTQIQQCFVELLRLGLWQNKPKKNQRYNWEETFKLSTEQAILGLILDGIYCLPQSVRPNSALLLHWLAIVAKIEQANKRLDAQVDKYSDFLDRSKIPYVILKGQGVAQNYPNPVRRQCGDIDLFVGEENYDYVNKLFKSLGAKTKEGEEMIRHCSWFIDGIEIEVHRYPAIMATPSYNRHLKKMTTDFFPENIDSVSTKDAIEIRVPSLEFNACYVLVHAMHHVYDRGVGLRQLLDWLMLIYNNNRHIDPVALKHNLRKLGLFKAGKAVAYIGVRYLGFKQQDLPIEAGEEKIAQILLDDIFENGNFGHYSAVNHNRPESKWAGKWYAFNQRTKRLLFLKDINPREAVWFNKYVIENLFYKLSNKRNNKK